MSDEVFRIGEIVEWNSREGWRECLILEGPDLLGYRDSDNNGAHGEEVGYYIKVPGIRPRFCVGYDPDVRFSVPNRLRRKRPPREELGDWELIPWQRPVKVQS